MKTIKLSILGLLVIIFICLSISQFIYREGLDTEYPPQDVDDGSNKIENAIQSISENINQTPTPKRQYKLDLNAEATKMANQLPELIQDGVRPYDLNDVARKIADYVIQNVPPKS